MSKSQRETERPAPVARARSSIAAVPVSELRDRLARTRAALAAVKRAPGSQDARKLETDFEREIRSLERDVSMLEKRAESRT